MRKVLEGGREREREWLTQYTLSGMQIKAAKQCAYVTMET